MRCQKHMARECPTGDLCELQGCQQPYGPPAAAVAVARQPIDLDYQPGRIMRGLMALTDRGEKAVRRGPTPFAAAASPAPEPAPMSQSLTVPPAPPPAPAPAPEQPQTVLALPPPEVRILEVPGPAWIVYLGDRPLGMTMKIERPR